MHSVMHAGPAQWWPTSTTKCRSEELRGLCVLTNRGRTVCGSPGSSLLSLSGLPKQEEKLILVVLLQGTTSVFLPDGPSAPLRRGIKRSVARCKGRDGGSLLVAEEELGEHHLVHVGLCLGRSCTISHLTPCSLVQTALGVKLQLAGAAWKGPFLL